MPPEAALADGCQELCAITDTSRFYRTKNVHCWPTTQRGWYPNRDKIDFGPARSHSAILTITCYLNNEFWLELAAVCALEADRLTSLKGAGMLQQWFYSLSGWIARPKTVAAKQRFTGVRWEGCYWQSRDHPVGTCYKRMVQKLIL